MDKIYDLTFIGAGPSSVFAILKLLENNYTKNICLIEKGNSLKTRKPNEIISGFCGAGTFSDSKLSSALDVGGVIPNLTQEDLNQYDNYILNMLNKFKQQTNNKEILKWDITNNFDTSNTNLEWNRHKTCHVGTENGQAIYRKIEEYFETQSNLDMLFNTNIINIDYKYNIYYIKDENNNIIKSKKLITSTGQKDILPSKLIEKFKLQSTPRAFQLGIRVVDEINPQYENIIKANYDFKFVKKYIYDNIKIRVRTFCCNSGNAHVCAEKSPLGFTCFNGHAYKTPDSNNHSVNYGIICEIEGLNKYSSKENQINLIRNINNISTWKYDNFNNIDEEPVPKRKLLDGFEHLKGYYPGEVIESLNNFINELNKIVNLNNARYLYPEVKLSGEVPDLNYKTFETKQPNLYMIGDCSVSRGIIKAAITGIIFAENQLKEV